MQSLEIVKMQDGGFVVFKSVMPAGRFDPVLPVFASTSIEEALKYIKKELTKEKAND